MATRPDPDAPSPPLSGLPDSRVVALDGLRGFMTILVVISHYFGEVPSGISGLMIGWVAVDMFFVLSGYLVGRMILDKMHHANFIQVFFVRRACRTLPIYVVCVLIVFILHALIDRPWAEADDAFPLWSYLTFTQNIFMVATNQIGSHWLAPTWTLGLEEHFYLGVPLLFMLVPRQRLAGVFVGIALAAVALRAGIHVFAPGWWMTAIVLLPGRADVLTCGILAALVIRSGRLDGGRYDAALRCVAPVLLVATCGLKLWDGTTGESLQIFGPLCVSLGCAAFLLTLVRDAPEAVRYRSPVLRFFGTTSYAVYLTHMPILGLLRGFLLGTKPDIATTAQWLVTFAALPICVVVGWVLTRWIEAPLTAYGRSWNWRERPRGAVTAGRPLPAA